MGLSVGIYVKYKDIFYIIVVFNYNNNKVDRSSSIGRKDKKKK